LDELKPSEVEAMEGDGVPISGGVHPRGSVARRLEVRQGGKLRIRFHLFTADFFI
jgi:hypothetical protein